MSKHLPILSILFLFIIFNSHAQDLQELKVTGSPKKLNSELVARLDQNGDYCAAIQVISDMDGFSYDSNDGIVGKIDNNPGRDIVYLTASERVLEIFKEGYEPLKIVLSKYGITLKQREMWQIKIAGDKKAETLPVTIQYGPSDANIYIDSKPVSGTTHKLSKGEHIVRIEKAGFQIREESIKIDEENVFFEWQLTKQPDAALQIETVPEGATIYLDGIKLGETPLAAFYQPGVYDLQIVKEGYITLDGQSLNISLPSTIKTYTLEENVGYLTINTHIGAQVYLNDQKYTNYKDVKLAPQLVKVKVTMNKAAPLEQQIVLKRNDTLTLDIYPVIITGTLQVAVTPFHAKIDLIGDAGEHYSATGMKIFENIPIGKYTINVSASDFNNKTEIIDLTSDKNENISISLERKSDLEKINGGDKTSTTLTEEKQEAQIFTVVESMPHFPGGDEARLKYLNENLIYPGLARESGIQGRVFVTFVVEEDGSLTNLRVLRDIGGGCGEEAIRLIKNMPKWTPGEQRGKTVRVQFNSAILFKL